MRKIPFESMSPLPQRVPLVLLEAQGLVKLSEDAQLEVDLDIVETSAVLRASTRHIALSAFGSTIIQQTHCSCTLRDILPSESFNLPNWGK